MTVASKIKQADVARVVKGALTGGMKVGTVEVDPETGNIIVRSLDGAPASSAPIKNPWDKLLDKK